MPGRKAQFSEKALGGALRSNTPPMNQISSGCSARKGCFTPQVLNELYEEDYWDARCFYKERKNHRKCRRNCKFYYVEDISRDNHHHCSQHKYDDSRCRIESSVTPKSSKREARIHTKFNGLLYSDMTRHLPKDTHQRRKKKINYSRLGFYEYLFTKRSRFYAFRFQKVNWTCHCCHCQYSIDGRNLLRELDIKIQIKFLKSMVLHECGLHLERIFWRGDAEQRVCHLMDYYDNAFHENLYGPIDTYFSSSYLNESEKSNLEESPRSNLAKLGNEDDNASINDEDEETSNKKFKKKRKKKIKSSSSISSNTNVEQNEEDAAGVEEGSEHFSLQELETTSNNETVDGHIITGATRVMAASNADAIMEESIDSKCQTASIESFDEPSGEAIKVIIQEIMNDNNLCLHDIPKEKAFSLLYVNPVSLRYFSDQHSTQLLCSHCKFSFNSTARCYIDLKAQKICHRFLKICKQCKKDIIPQFSVEAIKSMVTNSIKKYFIFKNK